MLQIYDIFIYYAWNYINCILRSFTELTIKALIGGLEFHYHLLVLSPYSYKNTYVQYVDNLTQ